LKHGLENIPQTIKNKEQAYVPRFKENVSEVLFTLFTQFHP